MILIVLQLEKTITIKTIGILTTLCTLFDFYHEQFGYPRYEILTIFSLQENFEQLMKINKSKHTFRIGVHLFVHYCQPLYRLPELLVAIIAGFYMHNMRNYDSKLTNKQTLISWACWLLSVGFIYRHVYDISRKWFSNLFYYAIEKSLWSLAICRIIFASHFHKTGGPIRWFLSLNMWQPFSKIGLSMYLICTKYIWNRRLTSLRKNLL